MLLTISSVAQVERKLQALVDKISAVKAAEAARMKSLDTSMAAGMDMEAAQVLADAAAQVLLDAAESVGGPPGWFHCT